MTPKVDTSQEIVEDYGEVIREARERLGYTHEDLAKKINEKDSLLRKVETSKLAPNLQLISKLEHTLKIKLLVPVAEEKTPVPHVASRELTLGDLMPTVRKGKGEDTAQRKP
jgi:putative transcription factor